MQAGRLGRLAEGACQRRVEHVLHQRALARARDTRHRHQALQRELDRHALQVVLACAFEHELGRGLVDETLDAATDVLPRAEVGARQRVGALDGLRRAVEHDLAAALAGAGAHIDQAIGREHHGRVVLDDDQRVAGIAQPVHRFDDAVHIARVQTDRRFVEHEHRVDERGAERGGEVDALHFAAGERARLAIERQVADADIAQVLQARADLVVEQLQRIVARGLAREEGAQAQDRQLHQVVQRQARQRFELLARPGHAHRHDALVLLAPRSVAARRTAPRGGRRLLGAARRGVRQQHRIGIILRADAPQQRFELQPRPAADIARRVAAVLRQEHADVHLVGLAFEITEEAPDAVPLLVPVALPVRRAFEHPLALLRIELIPRRVARDAGLAGVLHQVVLALLPRRRLQRLDGAAAQRLARVGNDEAPIDADDAAETAAGVAGAEGRVEREQRGHRIAVAQIALGAVQSC